MADRCLLLVEGEDDQHVVGHLLARYEILCAPYEKHRIPEGVIIIKNTEGIERLRDDLEVYVAEVGDVDRLGVVADADTRLASRWQSLRDALHRSGYGEVTRVPDPSGTVIEQAGKPVVGLWLMPDNTRRGALEDFVGSLIPAHDSLWPRARNAVNRIPLAERRFPNDHRSKAHVHTGLAWQEQPGTLMGSAIRQRYLDADAPHAQRLIAWIRRLFLV